ncbi:MAG: DUF123 domain-containing protein [Candidatus Heimdallarchaeota archaeon]
MTTKRARKAPTLHSLIRSQGTYVILLRMARFRSLHIGKLGIFNFKPGSYLYVGSAQGKTSTSLGYRLARHESPTKLQRWHIDYLLGVSEVLAFHLIISSKRMECFIAKRLSISIPRQYKGFGASDCRQKCGTHLFPASEKKLVSIMHELDYAIEMEGKTDKGTKLVKWKEIEKKATKNGRGEGGSPKKARSSLL